MLGANPELAGRCSRDDVISFAAEAEKLFVALIGDSGFVTVALAVQFSSIFLDMGDMSGS